MFQWRHRCCLSHWNSASTWIFFFLVLFMCLQATAYLCFCLRVPACVCVFAERRCVPWDGMCVVRFLPTGAPVHRGDVGSTVDLPWPVSRNCFSLHYSSLPKLIFYFDVLTHLAFRATVFDFRRFPSDFVGTIHFGLILNVFQMLLKEWLGVRMVVRIKWLKLKALGYNFNKYVCVKEEMTF